MQNLISLARAAIMLLFYMLLQIAFTIFELFKRPIVVHHFRALMLGVTSITEDCGCRKLKSTSFEQPSGLDGISFTKKVVGWFRRW
jgi:hypothetical protein